MTQTGSTTKVNKRSRLVRDAFQYAEQAHREQTRRGGILAFIDHPIAVAAVVQGAGFPEEVTAAALLHDVIEATPLDVEDIQQRFGDQVAHLVAKLTEDGSIPSYEERKREHRERIEGADGGAAAIYAADKLCNVRELRRLYEWEGEEVAKRYPAPLEVRIQLWLEDLEMLSRRPDELSLLPELELELHRLRADRVER